MSYEIIPESQLLNDRNWFKAYMKSIHSSKPSIIILKFYADWCSNCHKITEPMRTLSRKLATTSHKRVVYIEINTDKFKDIANLYKVYGIPHVMNIESNGYPDYQFVGADLPRLKTFFEMLNNQ